MRDKTGSIEEHCGNGAVIDTQADSEGSLARQKLYNPPMSIHSTEINDGTCPAAKSTGMLLCRSLERATHTAIRFDISITQTRITKVVRTLSMITVVLFISRKGKLVGAHNP